VRHLIRSTVTIITLSLLLAVLVSPAQADGTIFGSVGTDEQPEDTGLVCLALVGGTAILAGAVLMGKLRRTLS
jgi:hypothetical protein